MTVSEVNRYWVPNNVLADQSGWHPDDNEVVLAGEHDVALKAAQSELAALREELAKRPSEVAMSLQTKLKAAEQELDNERDRFMKTVDQLATSLKAAEQRNAELTTMLVLWMRMFSGEKMSPALYSIYSRTLQTLSAESIKPTESGASDTSKPSVGSTVLVCGGIKAIVKAHHADGLVVGAGDGYIVNEWSKP